MSAKNLIKYQTGNAVLPESVVTPRGNYIRYTGNETTIPSLMEYIKSKVNAARIQSIFNMLGASSPHRPSKKIPDRSLPSIIAGKLGMNDKDRIKIFGECQNPYTCISHATYTGYGPDNEAISNIDFSKNYLNYGFTRLNSMKDAEAGDIIQFYTSKRPTHAGLITGFNRDGLPTVTYSRGSVNPIHEDGETNMIYDNDNWTTNSEHSLLDGFNDRKIYRFIGNRNNWNTWQNEYNRLYKSIK